MFLSGTSILAIAILFFHSVAHAFPIREIQRSGWNPTTLYGNIASRSTFFDDMNQEGPVDYSIDGSRRDNSYYLPGEQRLFQNQILEKADDYTECFVKRREGDVECIVMNRDRLPGDAGGHRHFCYIRTKTWPKGDPCTGDPGARYFYAEDLGKEPRELEEIFRYFMGGGYHYEKKPIDRSSGLSEL